MFSKFFVIFVSRFLKRVMSDERWQTKIYLYLVDELQEYIYYLVTKRARRHSNDAGCPSNGRMTDVSCLHHDVWAQDNIMAMVA